MNDYLITILTVNYNTSDFIKLMLNALKKLTKNKYRVIICDNGSDKKDIVKLIYAVKEYMNVELIFRNQSESGNQGHAEALDILSSMVNTEFSVILDSDCCILMKNWDEYLISQLDKKNKLISSPRYFNNRKNNYPGPYIVLYDSKIYNKLNISSLPGDGKKQQDTAYSWKIGFEAGGYKIKLLGAESTRYNKNGLFRDILCAEFYTEQKKLIASHFGRGSSLGAAKYFKRFSVPVMSYVIKKISGWRAKRKWIQRCFNIIEKQSQL